MSDTNGSSPPSKLGRPTKKTPELCQLICDLIAEGETLRAICRDDAYPDITTVQRWLREDKDFQQQYGRAREDQADTFADEAVDVGRTATDKDSAACARELIKSLTWAASKIRPSKYGDKGGDVNVSVQAIVMSTDQQRELQDRCRQADERFLTGKSAPALENGSATSEESPST